MNAYKIYISGSVTGTDDYQERFQEAEDYLRNFGYEVINPVKPNALLPVNTSWEQYMDVAMAMLKMCDVVYMLKGWESSNGACIEYYWARGAKKKILFEK